MHSKIFQFMGKWGPDDDRLGDAGRGPSAVLSTQYRSLNPRQTEEVHTAANDSRLPPF